jgi:hypothetical protein
MTVKEIFDFVNFMINKHQSGNALNPDEYNLCLKYANLEYFKYLYGLPERYVFGRSLPNGYEMTQFNTDTMRAFKTSYPMNVNPEGIGLLPQDYVHKSSMQHSVNGKTEVIEILGDDQLTSRLSNPITGPTKKHAVCGIYGREVRYFPKDLSEVVFNYLRSPATPYFASNIVNDDLVYDPLNSTQVEFPENTHNDFLQFVLEAVSVNLREQFVYQNTLRRKAQGI